MPFNPSQFGQGPPEDIAIGSSIMEGILQGAGFGQNLVSNALRQQAMRQQMARQQSAAEQAAAARDATLAASAARGGAGQASGGPASAGRGRGASGGGPAPDVGAAAAELDAMARERDAALADAGAARRALSEQEDLATLFAPGDMQRLQAEQDTRRAGVDARRAEIDQFIRERGGGGQPPGVAGRFPGVTDDQFMAERASTPTSGFTAAERGAARPTADISDEGFFGELDAAAGLSDAEFAAMLEGRKPSVDFAAQAEALPSQAVRDAVRQMGGDASAMPEGMKNPLVDLGLPADMIGDPASLSAILLLADEGLDDALELLTTEDLPASERRGFVGRVLAFNAAADRRAAGVTAADRAGDYARFLDVGRMIMGEYGYEGDDLDNSAKLYADMMLVDPDRVPEMLDAAKAKEKRSLIAFETAARQILKQTPGVSQTISGESERRASVRDIDTIDDDIISLERQVRSIEDDIASAQRSMANPNILPNEKGPIQADITRLRARQAEFDKSLEAKRGDKDRLRRRHFSEFNPDLLEALDDAARSPGGDGAAGVDGLFGTARDRTRLFGGRTRDFWLGIIRTGKRAGGTRKDAVDEMVRAGVSRSDAGTLFDAAQ